MTDAPLLVVTGAAGRVGRITTAALAGSARLRLVDRAWPAHEHDGAVPGAARGPAAERVTADLADADAAAEVFAGADAVVHLAGDPRPTQTGAQALERVARVAVNVAEALERASVGRLVHASSVHAAGLYVADGLRPIEAAWPARPCCEYGTAKVFAENVFELLHRRTGASVIGLRLGLIGYEPFDAVSAGQWLGDEDYGRLLRAALTTDAGHAVLVAVSAGARGVWDLEPMERVLGIVPQQVPSPVHDGVVARRRPGERCLMLAGPQERSDRAGDADGGSLAHGKTERENTDA